MVSAISKKDRELIEKFNENIQWLIKNGGGIVQQYSYENQQLTEHITPQEAQKILGRSRTWINTRMIKSSEVSQHMNINWFLISGVDYHYEGNRLLFKRSSILRLKAELIQMGKEYEKKIA